MALIPYTIGSSETVLSNAEREAIAQYGPESSLGFVKSGTDSYRAFYTGSVDPYMRFGFQSMNGGLTLQGTFDAPASVSDDVWEVSDLPSDYDYCGAGAVIPNPHDDSLLMFVHVELWCGEQVSAYFSDVAILKSTDDGASWAYIGTILKLNNPFDDGSTTVHDIGNGGPVILGDYIYVYIREMAAENSTAVIGVARALAEDVYDAADLDDVPTFMKWGGSAWNEDGFTGLAAEVCAPASGYLYWPMPGLHSPTGTIMLAVVHATATTPDPGQDKIQIAMSKDPKSFPTPEDVVSISTITYPQVRFPGYSSARSGNGNPWVYYIQGTFWDNIILYRKQMQLITGSRRTGGSKFRGGPACSVAR